jgi:hypothetical protein
MQVFNKVCVLMQFNNRENLKMEQGKILELRTKKYMGVFAQIQGRNKVLPLYLAVRHSQMHSDTGIQIYWSRKNKQPSLEDNEG